MLRVRHWFVRLYGLAGKTVVLDEVHAYDTFTSTLLDRLIEWLAALGATIVLLSATLPRTRRNAIVSAFCSGVGGNAAAPVERPYPRITIATGATTTVCHVPPRGEASTVTLRRVDPDLETIAIAVERAVRDGGCIGWICNTVSRAQTACEALARVAPNVPRLLIHARMLPETRTKRETVLQQLLGPERGSQRPPCYVVIGTQVLEQSLDIDFDLLVTDLAPIDLLLQRIGRLHRHRERSNRAAAHSSPEVWIAHAAGPPEEIPIQDVAVVYAEWLVRQTLRVLEGKSHIVLPNDIERLVEEVYGPAPPPADGALFGSYINHFGGGVALRQNAEQRLIPKPSCEDDIFRALTMPFADDEGAAVHEELKALTRDAQPAVQMVCLTGVDGLVYAAEDDTEAFDLDTPPAPSLAARLAHRTINVTHPAIHAALLNDPQYYPTAWRDSPLLRHRRAVVFTNNVATVAGRCLELHPELGLRY